MKDSGWQIREDQEGGLSLKPSLGTSNQTESIPSLPSETESEGFIKIRFSNGTEISVPNNEEAFISFDLDAEYKKLLESNQESLDQVKTQLTDVKKGQTRIEKKVDTLLEIEEKRRKEAQNAADKEKDAREKAEARQRTLNLIQGVDQAGQLLANSALLFSDSPEVIKKAQIASQTITVGSQILTSFLTQPPGLAALSSANIALSFASSFGGSSGPSTDELILEALQQISEQIETLRQEMHERFDKVDARLEDILNISNEILSDVRNNNVEIIRLQNFSLEIAENINALRQETRIFTLDILQTERAYQELRCLQPSITPPYFQPDEASECLSSLLVFPTITAKNASFTGRDLPVDSPLHSDPYFNINQLNLRLQADYAYSWLEPDVVLANPWAWFVGTRNMLDFIYQNPSTWDPFSRDATSYFSNQSDRYALPANVLPQLIEDGLLIEQATSRLASSSNGVMASIINDYDVVAQAIQDTLKAYWEDEFSIDLGYTKPATTSALQRETASAGACEPCGGWKTDRYDINPWLKPNEQSTAYVPKFMALGQESMPYCGSIGVSESDIPRDVMGSSDLATESGNDLQLQMPTNIRTLIPHSYLVAEALGIGDIQVCYQGTHIDTIETVDVTNDSANLVNPQPDSLAITWQIRGVFKVDTNYTESAFGTESNEITGLNQPYLSIFNASVSSLPQDLVFYVDDLRGLNDNEQSKRKKTYSSERWNGSPNALVLPTPINYAESIVDSLNLYGQDQESELISADRLTGLLNDRFDEMISEFMVNDANIFNSETSRKRVQYERDLAGLDSKAALLEQIVLLGLSRSLEEREELRELVLGRSRLINKQYVDDRLGAITPDALVLFGELMQDHERLITVSLVRINTGTAGPEAILRVWRDGIDLGEVVLTLGEDRRSVELADIEVILHSFQDYAIARVDSMGHRVYQGVNLILTDVNVDDSGVDNLVETLSNEAFIEPAMKDYVVLTKLTRNAVNTRIDTVLNPRNALLDRNAILSDIVEDIQSQTGFNGESLRLVDRILAEAEYLNELAITAQDEIALRNANPPINIAPIVQNPVNSISVSTDQQYLVRDLEDLPAVFQDANDKNLIYSFVSMDTSIVQVETIGSIVRLVPIGRGTTQVSGFASDYHGATTTHTFDVVVNDKTIEQYIPLTPGWNIVAANVDPIESDVQTVFQPLIDSGDLVEVRNANRQTLAPEGGLWLNNIGLLEIGLGYLVRTDRNTNLIIRGTAVPLPKTVSLSDGWNLVGYPAQGRIDALALFQPLIDQGALVKVQNSRGQSLVKIRGRWWNFIGTINSGEGFWVRTTEATELNFNNPPASKLVSTLEPEAKSETDFFRPKSMTNRHLSMNLYITQESLVASGLQEGDEIAVYDGDVCVGSVKVGQINADREMLSLIANADDRTTPEKEGFNPGNRILFRVWDAERQMERHDVAAVFYPVENSESSDVIFTERGTALVNIHVDNSHPVILTSGLQANYPNPFNSGTLIRYQIAEPAQVTLKIFNVLGQSVKTLVSEQYQPVGFYELKWNGTDESGKPVTAGIYFTRLQFSTGSKQAIDQTHKILLLR